MKKASPFSQRIKKPKKMRSSRGKAPLRMTPVALDGISRLHKERAQDDGLKAHPPQWENSFDGVSG
ncbi:MAG TPA: hypothetical protein DF698_09580 [Candidatus Atribacteria bacterium]|nr:hypothetical protein [Candidatus Atribacteria bacterium]